MGGLMLLKGFGLSGYRSFGEELAMISPLKKVNFIIGKNNSGKSNIINFLSEMYPHLHKGLRQNSTPTVTLKEIDKHKSSNDVTFRISFSPSESEVSEFIEKKLPKNLMSSHRTYAQKLLASPFFYNGGIYNFTFYRSNNGQLVIDIDPAQVEKVLSPPEWQSLWVALTGYSGGDLHNSWIPTTLKELFFIPSTTPEIEIIPAIRKIGDKGSKPSDFSGEGIIERLAQIQNPSYENQDLKIKFDKINNFIRNVLNDNSATIEIPYERDMINIHMDNKTLPIESLGTGIHEVVILAAASTLLENTVVCVEEPELHLHPLLQKKLIRYLFKETNNQYFFTTHSAHLLDSVESEIFHVTHNDGSSKVISISNTKERSQICNDLGYKASDILQTNLIIWVEGPSDRIYLNNWIKSVDRNLVEGIHYSIMFYGGKLFSHLSALDSDEYSEIVEKFISLRRLNRNSIIVFDSDKTKTHDRINKTKTRLKNEFNSGSGFCWVTEGREIENYLDMELLEKSILNVHPSALKIKNKSKWSNLLNYVNKKDGKIKTANKVKIARDYIAQNETNLNIYDLKQKINKVIKTIRSVNNI